MVYRVPQQVPMQVLARPWPADVPAPVPLSGTGPLWLSVVRPGDDYLAVNAAWRDAGYSGLIFLQPARVWVPYLAGCPVRHGDTLAAAAAEVGLPDRLSFALMRLSALLARLSELLSIAAHRYDTWRLGRRARRVLREVR